MKIELDYNILDLRNLASSYSTEAMSIDLPNRHMVNNLNDYRVSCFKFIDKLIPSLFKKTEVTDVSKIIKILKDDDKCSYLNLLDKKFPVPIGLSVYLNTYMTNMVAFQNLANQIMIDVLIPSEAYLSSIVMDWDKIESNYPLHNVKFNDLKGIKKQFKDMFQNSSKAEQPWSKIVPNNSAWETIEVDYIKLTQLINKYKPDEIKVKVDNISKLSTDIISHLINQSSKVSISKKSSSFLANVFLQIAEEVEFYGILRSQYIQLEPVFNLILKELKKK